MGRPKRFMFKGEGQRKALGELQAAGHPNRGGKGQGRVGEATMKKAKRSL